MQVGPAFHTPASKSTHLATGFTHFVVLHGDACFLLPPPRAFHGSHTIRWSTWHTTMSKSAASVEAPFFGLALATLSIRLHPLEHTRLLAGSGFCGTQTAVQSSLCRTRSSLCHRCDVCQN